MLISICIPVYNAELTIANLVKEIFQTLKNYQIEIVLVNDCSFDHSEEVCQKICEKNDNVKFISLRKNVGEHNAVICALNYANGDYIVIMDDDFQNQPKEVIQLIEHIQQGFDVVYVKYHIKKHSFLRNLGSHFNDVMASWIIEKPKGLYLSSFKAIHQEIVREIIKYRGPFTYIDGLILRTTQNISSINVEHHHRKEGQSNYTFKKLVSLWLDMFINFSIKPLRFLTFIGLILSMMSFISLIYVIFEKIFYPEIPLGWASLMIVFLFVSGVQMIFLGLLGEFIGKNYLHANGTPQYTVKRSLNC